MPFMPLRRLFGSLAVVWSLSSVTAAHAATITVDTAADDTTVNGNCSLREAVIAANTDGAMDGCASGSLADTIILPAGSYTLSLTGPGEDAAATGDLDVTADLDIVGAGASATAITGSGDRVLDLDPGGTGISVGLTGLTVQGGSSISEGGG